MTLRCSVCGQPCNTETEMGEHLRKHGVNLFPELMRLDRLLRRIMVENRALVAKVKELESRLRIVT